MDRPSTPLRTAVLAAGCAALLAGCATSDPWARKIAHEEEKGTCTGLIERRLATSLAVTQVPSDIDGAVSAIIVQLPQEERDALARAGKIFVAEHGNAEFPRGGDLEHRAYWSAFYRGFAKASICSWSRRSLSEFVTAEIFVDKLDTLLRARGVDTGSPDFAHTDLVVALVRAAAGLPSNNSPKPMPLRGTD